MKKKVKLIVLLLLLTYALGFAGCGTDHVIGAISGAENEYIIIEDVTYVRDEFCDFSSKDRGAYLGDVTNTEITMRIYSVSGDETGDYIYALWDWEGDFYVRQEQ